jgi:hypothetical protein
MFRFVVYGYSWSRELSASSKGGPIYRRRGGSLTSTDLSSSPELPDGTCYIHLTGPLLGLMPSSPSEEFIAEAIAGLNGRPPLAASLSAILPCSAVEWL